MIRNDTDYALRMLLHLAEQRPHGITSSELSARLDVPHSFAQKILRRLAAVGIIQVRSGRSGGFNFNMGKPLRDVSLMDVIIAIQGSPLLKRCTGDLDACIRQPSCRISASLRTIQDKLNKLLCRTSLSDIIGQPNKDAQTVTPPRKTRAVTKRSFAQRNSEKSRL